VKTYGTNFTISSRLLNGLLAICKNILLWSLELGVGQWRNRNSSASELIGNGEGCKETLYTSSINSSVIADKNASGFDPPEPDRGFHQRCGSRIRIFLDLQDPHPELLVTSTDPAPDPYIKQK
jgi:hypothetical protein